MKRIICVFLALVMLLALAACGQAAAPAPAAEPAAPAAEAPADQAPAAFDWATAEPVKIKFAHGYAGGELACEMVDEWMALVTERSQGAIEWDYYPGGSMGTITELIEQTDLGALDCTLTDTSQLENFVDEYAILFYPFLMQSYDHQVKVLNSDIMNYFTGLLDEESSLHAIGYYVNGVRNICSKMKLTDLADCQGVVMRTPEIQVYKDVATLLGMSPTTISYSEMYTALSTGVCEAVECPNNSLYPGGYHQIAPYILKSGHMYSSCALEFNKDVWNAYPAEVQALLKDCFAELTEAHAQKVIAADEEYYSLYEKDGATVSDWDDPNEVAAACESYWLTNAEKLGPDAVTAVNAIIALRS